MEDPVSPVAAERLLLTDIVARSGASAQLLHECESLGLLGSTAHDEAGRCTYDAWAVSTLRFVRRAHALGFETPQVIELLALWKNGRRASFDVKRIALARAEKFAQQIEELERMKRLLERLTQCCEGDHSPECPILDELADLTGFARCETQVHR